MLPGLAPSHTRAGFIGGNRLRVEKYAPTPDDYARTESGLWLLPGTVTELEVNKGIEKLSILATSQDTEGMREAANTRRLANILGASSIDWKGCLLGGISDGEDPAQVAMMLAESEMRTFSLDDPSEVDLLRLCGEAACYNARHFDFSFGRPTLKERKVELNPDWFNFLPSGRIKTLWGDILPSVAKSLEYYIKFQRMSFPFVCKDKSLLTPGSISQIRFHPLTGCWESWSYYCRPDGNLNWQFDGYGRLYRNYKTRKVDLETGEIRTIEERGHYLAHRVTWAASPGRYLKKGYHLNHKCSYRRCCNPLHLEQIEASANVRHGVVVQSALRMAEAGSTGSADNYLKPDQLAPYHDEVRQIYIDICKAKGLVY